MRPIQLISAAIVAAGLCSSAIAQTVQVRVSVENLAPANSVAFAALRVAFNNGTFDTFNEGQAGFLLGSPSIATAPIVTIAEGGLGQAWFPAFADAEPTATLGTVGVAPFLPGAMTFADFTVNTDVNPYFTFGAMVVPSNDYFIGNDSPAAHRLFNTDGTLALTNIAQTGNDIWNAGSETENPLNAAFIQGGTNALRENQNGVVERDFDLGATFNGLTTGAGYIFDAQLSSTTPIYRINFSVVPEPSSLMALASAGILMRRRR